MLSFITSPLEGVLFLAGAIVLVVLSVALWFQLQRRVRRYGGGWAAAAIMAAAIVGLLASITPGLMSFDVGIFVLLGSAIAIYRPEQVVRFTGGPNLRWRALQEGRELQLLVKQRGGPSLASRNPEVQERYAALAELRGPGTEAYIDLLQETLLADPEAPGMAEKLEEMAQADADLRESLGVRPIWERDLERRAAGEEPATT